MWTAQATDTQIQRACDQEVALKHSRANSTRRIPLDNRLSPLKHVDGIYIACPDKRPYHKPGQSCVPDGKKPLCFLGCQNKASPKTLTTISSSDANDQYSIIC